MGRPPKKDFSAWIDHIQNLIYNQIGVTVLDNNTVSFRDRLTIDRYLIITEMNYWKVRQKAAENKALKIYDIAAELLNLSTSHTTKSPAQATPEDVTLKIHNMVANHFKNAALIAMKLPTEESEEIFKDLSDFGKQVASGKTPKSYSHKVFVGRAISNFLSENRWPKRSELSTYLQDLRRPIKPASMDLCLEYFGVRDFVRDNQKG